MHVSVLTFHNKIMFFKTHHEVRCWLTGQESYSLTMPTQKAYKQVMEMAKCTLDPTLPAPKLISEQNPHQSEHGAVNTHTHTQINGGRKWSRIMKLNVQRSCPSVSSWSIVVISRTWPGISAAAYRCTSIQCNVCANAPCTTRPETPCPACSQLSLIGVAIRLRLFPVCN